MEWSCLCEQNVYDVDHHWLLLWLTDREGEWIGDYAHLSGKTMFGETFARRKLIVYWKNRTSSLATAVVTGTDLAGTLEFDPHMDGYTLSCQKISCKGTVCGGRGAISTPLSVHGKAGD